MDGKPPTSEEERPVGPFWCVRFGDRVFRLDGDHLEACVILTVLLLLAVFG